MKIKLAWVEDPITKKVSVSLTNFVLSLVFLLVAGVLNLMGKTKDTSIATEYFGISSALYFGRRINLKGNKYDAEKTENS